MSYTSTVNGGAYISLLTCVVTTLPINIFKKRLDHVYAEGFPRKIPLLTEHDLYSFVDQ